MASHAIGASHADEFCIWLKLVVEIQIAHGRFFPAEVLRHGLALHVAPQRWPRPEDKGAAQRIRQIFGVTVIKDKTAGTAFGEIFQRAVVHRVG